MSAPANDSTSDSISGSARDPLFDPAGLRVVVTGGARGLGAMIAEGFARRGASLLITSRKPDLCETAVSHLRQWTECTGVAVDVADEAGVAAVVAAVEGWGGVDVLVNNAGATWGASLDDYPAAQFDRIYAINVRAQFRLTQALLAALTADATAQAPSHVINIGSVDGLKVPHSANYAYSASKAAVHHLTRHLAHDLAPRHVCVNAIAPGPFYSKMTAFALDDREERTALEGRVPIGRIGEPNDIVAAAVFLSTAASAYITGIVLPVDGGLAVVG